jgi:hypothetical protein
VGKHKDQVRSMMHSDLPDTASFEVTMTGQYPETGVLHWHRQEPEWTCGQKGGIGDSGGHIACDGHGATSGSLFCALAFFFDHFAHDALLKEFPKPKEPIFTPDKLPALMKVPSKDQTPAYYLKWLVLLLGDLHQPLHWLHEHNHGREIRVSYNGTEYNLLQFWEDFLPIHLQKMETGVQPFMMDKDFDVHAKAWAHKSPTELFRDWAKENAEKLCIEVYRPMTVNHADGTRVESPFTLTEELFQKWLKMAQELIQLAGERMAFVLNEILEHKRHKEAHKDGRGLHSRKVAVDVEKKEGSKDGKTHKSPAPKPHSQHAHALPTMTGGKDVGDALGMWYKQLKIEEKRRSRSAAAYNGIMAVVLVPLILYAYWWHEKIGGGSIWKIAKEKM